MKLSVIIASVVFGMGMTAASKVSALDPWCNPSYCPPTPTYPGGGDTSTSGRSGDAFLLVSGAHMSCDTPVQERYAAVLASFLSLPLEYRVDYYENSDRGEYFVAYRDIPELHGRLAYESWKITDPSSSVPIDPNPVPIFDCRR
ncbi:hypothetical protein ACSYAP_001499 [Stenotrophomonas sp. STK1_22]|uniref:hypothetical protein n=1 Tax=Stenotrophomonas TaxID=40323 RepID=UPI000A47D894|nr:hypothetical protein [Stenotrophomonas maltophilia]